MTSTEHSTESAVSGVEQVLAVLSPSSFSDTTDGILLPQNLWMREKCPPHGHPSFVRSLEPGLEVAQPILLLAGRGPSDLQ